MSPSFWTVGLVTFRVNIKMFSFVHSVEHLVSSWTLYSSRGSMVSLRHSANVLVNEFEGYRPRHLATFLDESRKKLKCITIGKSAVYVLIYISTYKCVSL